MKIAAFFVLALFASTNHALYAAVQCKGKDGQWHPYDSPECAPAPRATPAPIPSAVSSPPPSPALRPIAAEPTAPAVHPQPPVDFALLVLWLILIGSAVGIVAAFRALFGRRRPPRRGRGLTETPARPPTESATPTGAPRDPLPPGASAQQADILDAWSDRTTTVWQGGPHIVAFTYTAYRAPRTRRQVAVDAILRDPARNLYFLSGHCYLRNERRTFRVDAINTMILDRGQRYDVYDWIERITGTYPE